MPWQVPAGAGLYPRQQQARHSLPAAPHHSPPPDPPVSEAPAAHPPPCAAVSSPDSDRDIPGPCSPPPYHVYAPSPPGVG